MVWPIGYSAASSLPYVMTPCSTLVSVPDGYLRNRLPLDLKRPKMSIVTGQLIGPSAKLYVCLAVNESANRRKYGSTRERGRSNAPWMGVLGVSTPVHYVSATSVPSKN